MKIVFVVAFVVATVLSTVHSAPPRDFYQDAIEDQYSPIEHREFSDNDVNFLDEENSSDESRRQFIGKLINAFFRFIGVLGKSKVGREVLEKTVEVATDVIINSQSGQPAPVEEAPIPARRFHPGPTELEMFVKHLEAIARRETIRSPEFHPSSRNFAQGDDLVRYLNKVESISAEDRENAQKALKTLADAIGNFLRAMSGSNKPAKTADSP